MSTLAACTALVIASTALFVRCEPHHATTPVTSGVAEKTVTWKPGDVLAPPADTAAHCYKTTFSEFTHRYPICAKIMWRGEDPDHECCRGLEEFYGPASIKPSRNCWCDKDVWDWFAAFSDLHYYDLSVAMLVCSHLGHPVGFHQEDGSGYCNGTAPDPEVAAAATTGSHDKIQASPKLSAWLNEIKSDPLVRASVATGIMSAVGLSLMVWPIVFEAAFARRDACSRRRK
ncbi:hypothetical protein HYH03_005727 [Edaphochlamys debaryana]|uniref:Uncharacterized protein n=1 Tax=Edaphochlamys debaryana TaxID=47281 RepID=A0A835Y6N3_9CHLO|nr:hypothetical protein HYH03_005727 [Edaphochlamys debaryana]|eukprot:KAG2496124.1 hypothetical protein HYH03_005727 [Edaphochlamys debaryana]